MIRRIIAALLAWLLCVGAALPSMAEGVEIVIEDEGTIIEAAPESPEDPALSLDGLEGGLVANEAASDATPIPLTLTESCTMQVTQGLSYQIIVPGKKIKTCKSGNKKVATVTKRGLVQAVKVGTAKITVTPKKGSKLVLKLKVVDPNTPTAVAIDAGTAATLTVGDQLQLAAAVSPATAPQGVTWKSDNKRVARVSRKGLVTAVGPGRATITATAGNGVSSALTLDVRRAGAAHYMISHAMGGIDGNNYSNCLEGFQENYAEGHRIFEVDLLYTSDDRIVLWHHWDRPFCSKYKKGKVPTYEQFMSSKIYDRYTPMDLEDLLRLMNEYPDIRVVVDGKCSRKSEVKKQYRTIVSTAKSLGAAKVLDRLVVEIYSKEMYDVVDGVYHFSEYLLTLYKMFDRAPSKSRLKSAAKFCQQKGIATIAMYADWWKPKYAGVIEPYGLDIALYTVNSAHEARDYFEEGVTALFTDFLPPV